MLSMNDKTLTAKRVECADRSAHGGDEIVGGVYASGDGDTWSGLRRYVASQSTGWARYLLEQVITLFFGWIPGPPGIAARALFYRVILGGVRGVVAIEAGVRLAQPRRITVNRGVYIDQGVYLHACPEGIRIGEGTFLMHHAVLHVYNFRGLPHAGIRIGRDSLVGEFCVIRGQGGVSIGDRVYLSPMVQILAVDHVFDDPGRPFSEQGLSAQGIVIEDDVWIGAGAIVTDGVHIGKGAVVGAGAVVTRDIPSHTLALGVPARVVREIGSQPLDAADDTRQPSVEMAR